MYFLAGPLEESMKNLLPVCDRPQLPLVWQPRWR